MALIWVVFNNNHSVSDISDWIPSKVWSNFCFQQESTILPPWRWWRHQQHSPSSSWTSTTAVQRLIPSRSGPNASSSTTSLASVLSTRLVRTAWTGPHPGSCPKWRLRSCLPMGSMSKEQTGMWMGRRWEGGRTRMWRQRWAGMRSQRRTWRRIFSWPSTTLRRKEQHHRAKRERRSPRVPSEEQRRSRPRRRKARELKGEAEPGAAGGESSWKPSVCANTKGCAGTLSTSPARTRTSEPHSCALASGGRSPKWWIASSCGSSSSWSSLWASLSWAKPSDWGGTGQGVHTTIKRLYTVLLRRANGATVCL